MLRSTIAVHPRGRGKHSIKKGNVIANIGSSPRARETLDDPKTRDTRERFIPAGAGNICIRLWSKILYAVHPRGRGKHSPSLLTRAVPFGSSPRARETSCRKLDAPALCRFIPAGAGNMHLCVNLAPFKAVHPRGRGKHLLTALTPTRTLGSSPRARETSLALPLRPESVRFIPAGAGNIDFAKARPTSSPVHPRGRGKHFV